MFYRDLSFYRDGDEVDVVTVFPSVKNIGWLDGNFDYSQGFVSDSLTHKLREIIFLDLKNDEDKKKVIMKKNRRSIFIACMLGVVPILALFALITKLSNMLQ